MKSLVISVVLLLTAMFVIPGSSANARTSGCDGESITSISEEETMATTDEAGSTDGCDIGEKGTLGFATGSAKVSSALQDALKALADKMRAHPDCKVILNGTTGGSKFAQQLNWDRINNVIEYLNNNLNIDRNAFIFQQDGGASQDSVDFQFVGRDVEGPSSVAPPHPDLGH